MQNTTTATEANKVAIQEIHAVFMHDQDADTSYLDQEGFEERKRAYQNDEFEYVGIQLRAELLVGSTTQVIRSGGLWGTESDSDREHFQEIWNDELEELRSQLELLCPEALKEAIANNTFKLPRAIHPSDVGTYWG